MERLLAIVLCVQAVFGGHVDVNVRMPYLSPAGVTYIGGASQAYSSPVLLPAAPAPGTTTTFHGNGRFLGFARRAAVAVQPAAALSVQPAAAVTAAVTAAVATVPVVQRNVDVLKPAVKTSRYEVRRPAIEKHFYDVEERVVVRPAGSALVEYDQPHSKIHKGSVISPVVPTVPVELEYASSTPAYTTHPDGDDDSVVVEARAAVARAQSGPQLTPHQKLYLQQLLGTVQGNKIDVDSHERSGQQVFTPQQQIHIKNIFDQQQRANNALLQVRNQNQFNIEQSVERQTELDRQTNEQAQLFKDNSATAAVGLQYKSQNFQQQTARNVGSNMIASISSEYEEPSRRDDQQKLIELLTAREGITEEAGAQEQTGPVRGRVISAQLQDGRAAVAGEKVSTRRIVVSRPIETVQQVDVLEPVTKLHRIVVNQPTLFHAAHLPIQPTHHLVNAYHAIPHTSYTLHRNL